MRIVMRSPSGSVTPLIEMFVNLWLGGHNWLGTAAGWMQSGGAFVAVGVAVAVRVGVLVGVSVGVFVTVNVAVFVGVNVALGV